MQGAFGCDKSIAAFDQFRDFVPVDRGPVETQGYPASGTDVGGEIEAFGLRGNQSRVFAWQDFAGHRHNAVVVMVVQEVGEDPLPNPK